MTWNLAHYHHYLRRAEVYFQHESCLCHFFSNVFSAKVLLSDGTMMQNRETWSSDHPSSYQCDVDWLTEWCNKNTPVINAKNTEEIIFGLPPDCQLPSVTMPKEDIKQGSSYGYLGVTV